MLFLKCVGGLFREQLSFYAQSTDIITTWITP